MNEDSFGQEEERQLLEDMQELEQASRQRKQILEETIAALVDLERIKVEEEIMGRNIRCIQEKLEVNRNDERSQRCVCVIAITGLGSG